MKRYAKEDQTALLDVVAERWYAWEMLPGYTSSSDFDPYVSSIYLKQVVPLKTGKGLLQISFFNAWYAEGVQDFQLTYQSSETSTVVRADEFGFQRPRFASLRHHRQHELCVVGISSDMLV